jgi:beta-lactamase regulating signal transducer with metallopeptidase domain
MGLFFIHIIKSSLCLIILYLPYKMLLSKETFYKVNRFVLLAIIVVSISVPFLKMTIAGPSVATVPQQLNNIGHIMLQKQIHFNNLATDAAEGFYSLLFFIYIVGVIIQLVITVKNFVKIYSLVYRSKHIAYEGYTLAVTDHEQSPFSWGRYIVISVADNNSSPEIIIQHELIHLKRFHSTDLLIAECAIILFWFNPVVWLLKKELKDIHEFEVDDTLLKQGIDAKQYQLLLIRKAVGQKIYSIANTFNQSNLSKRIKMMLKQRSSPWAQLKYLCIILLTLFSVIAFATPDITSKLKGISQASLGKFIKKQVNALTTNRPSYPALKGGKPVAHTEEAKLVPASMPETNTGNAQKTAGPIINVTEHNQNTPTSPLCIVDGKETSYSAFQQIIPNAIRTVKVLNPKDAVAQYGEKGKNGAVIISLNSTLKTLTSGGIIDTVFSTREKPVYVFFSNGKKVGDHEQELLNNQLSNILNNPEMIESSITILGKAAISKYGEMGKNGVVELYLK